MQKNASIFHRNKWRVRNVRSFIVEDASTSFIHRRIIQHPSSALSHIITTNVVKQYNSHRDTERTTTKFAELMTPRLVVKRQLSGHEMLLVTAPVRCLGNKSRHVQHEVKTINQGAMTSIQPGPHWQHLCHYSAYYEGTHTLTILHLLYSLTLNYRTTFAANHPRSPLLSECLLITGLCLHSATHLGMPLTINYLRWHASFWN